MLLREYLWKYILLYLLYTGKMWVRPSLQNKCFIPIEYSLIKFEDFKMNLAIIKGTHLDMKWGTWSDDNCFKIFDI